MAKSLGSDIHRIEQSLSFFMFGVAFGQVVGGSISDIKGRISMRKSSRCQPICGKNWAFANT